MALKIFPQLDSEDRVGVGHRWVPARGQRIADAILDTVETVTIAFEDEQRRSSHSPLVTIVIPVYNEAASILAVVQSVQNLPVDKQIIVVDDGSNDGTTELVYSLRDIPGIEVVLHPANRGKGAALQSGFARARGTIVIVQDADHEYDPIDILKVIAPIQHGAADVVYGSRYLGSAHQDQSYIHRLGNRWLTRLSNWMTGQSITDMETCYKAFRREILDRIEIEQPRFGFEPEITAKVSRRGIRILEVPVSYRSRSWSEGKKIGVRDLLSTLWCIAKYRFQ